MSRRNVLLTGAASVMLSDGKVAMVTGAFVRRAETPESRTFTPFDYLRTVPPKMVVSVAAAMTPFIAQRFGE